jgi:hypothetical protein
MPRARNIKPSFFTNEKLVDLPYEARLMFIGLWTLADRAGRLEDRPKRIKMSLFPADDIDTNKILNMLEKTGFIVRYSFKDEPYIQVVNFVKHQNPHVNERQSTIPAPESNGAAHADSLNPDSLNPESLSGITFDGVWAMYPKREGSNPKSKAEQHWNARLKEGHTAEEMRQGVERYIKYSAAKGNINTEFVMQAKRFFGTEKPFLEEWQVQSGQPARNGSRPARKTLADYQPDLRTGDATAITGSAKRVV